MSLESVRQALEERLAAMTPAVATAWENMKFVPTADVPYQEVSLLTNTPDNTAIGGSYFREQGVFQITLCYPLLKGTKDVMARAVAIRNQFRRGLVLTKNGIHTTIETTPSIGPGIKDRDRWRVPVSVRFYAEVFS